MKRLASLVLFASACFEEAEPTNDDGIVLEDGGDDGTESSGGESSEGGESSSDGCPIEECEPPPMGVPGAECSSDADCANDASWDIACADDGVCRFYCGEAGTSSTGSPCPYDDGVCVNELGDYEEGSRSWVGFCATQEECVDLGYCA